MIESGLLVGVALVALTLAALVVFVSAVAVRAARAAAADARASREQALDERDAERAELARRLAEWDELEQMYERRIAVMVGDGVTRLEELSRLRHELIKETADADAATAENRKIKAELLTMAEALGGAHGELAEVARDRDVLRATLLMVADRLGLEVDKDHGPSWEQIDAAIQLLMMRSKDATRRDGLMVNVAGDARRRVLAGEVLPLPAVEGVDIE